MSAVIAAEFSSTESRGTTLAAVFLAQPVGRLLAYAIGLGVLHGLSSSDIGVTDETAKEKLVVDAVWRLVLGLAGVPAILAIGLRFYIPETPRFYSAIKRDLKKAKEVVTKMGSKSPRLREDIESLNSEAEESLPDDKLSWNDKAREYFFGDTKGWKPLMAISIQWLLLDVVFYGMGLDSPGTLAVLWLDRAPASINYSTIPGFGVWKNDLANPNANIYETLHNNIVRTFELTFVTSVIGSLAVIMLINYVSRRKLFMWTSWVLCVLLACTAVSVSHTYATQDHYASMVFYALVQLVLNLGPNTLTFVMAAEAFPTEFRGFCYGIAAASGKVGAVIVRPIIASVGKDYVSLTVMLSVFAFIMLCMGLLAWLEPFGIALPVVQEPRPDRNDDVPPTLWTRLDSSRLKNKTLEDISPWPMVESASKSKPPGSNGNVAPAAQESGISSSNKATDNTVVTGIDSEQMPMMNLPAPALPIQTTQD
jgi:PHS family inorganic phosphate transporter-like MFS transporter